MAAIASALVPLLACGSSRGADSADTDAESTGAIDLPVPDFLEPANGELHLAADRTQDVTLAVSAQAGVTRVMIDNRSVGTLAAGSAIGELDAGSLRLFVRGGLVPGLHSLSLRTPDAVETEASETVTVFIDAAQVPTWAFDAEPTIVATGDALVLGPSGAGAALGLVVDDGLTSSLRAWPPDEDGWDLDVDRGVALPGHVAAGADALVALDHRPEADGADALRVAWTIGAPGSGVGVVEVEWAADDDGVARTGFVPDRAWLGTREWTEIGRPVLAGPLVLAEVTALVDSEHGHPGDQVLGFTPFSTLESSTPQRIPLGTADLDRAGLVLDSLRDDTIAIGLRIDHLRPAVLEIATTGAASLRPSEAIVDDARWGDVVGPLVTSTGAFRSRFVAGLHRDRNAIVLAWLDDGGGNEPDVRTVVFPDEALATGTPALALVDGLVVVLVPRGESDAVAITTASDSVVVQTLPGATCDGLAAPRSDVGNADARVELACLRARELTVGVLHPEADR